MTKTSKTTKKYYLCKSKNIHTMFDIDKSKAINSLLFVMRELGVELSDKHKIFKTLYFADQKHLIRYGRPITGDTYIKMKYGPVPSYIKDIAYEKKEKGLVRQIGEYNLQSNYSINMDDLSESEIECLREAISENKDCDFSKLTSKSHDKAWGNTAMNNPIDYMDIAKAATDDKDMLEYIRINALNDSFQFATV